MHQLEQPLPIARFNNLAREVASTLALLNKANETARDAKEAISTFVQSHPDIDITRLEELYLLTSSFIEALNNDNEKTKRDLQQCHTLLANINLRIKNHLAEEISSSISEEDTVDTLTAIHSQLSEDISMLNQNYGAKKKTLDDDKIKKSGAEELRQKAEEARKEYDRWQRVNAYIGDANGTKFQKIAQSYILGSLLNSANAYLQRLAPRYTLKAVPGTLYISLEDAYQGFATRGTTRSVAVRVFSCRVPLPSPLPTLATHCRWIHSSSTRALALSADSRSPMPSPPFAPFTVKAVGMWE